MGSSGVGRLGCEFSSYLIITCWRLVLEGGYDSGICFLGRL